MIEPLHYSSIIKTQWKKGNLPTVTHGLYGEVLTKENISLEHLIPHSKGGRTTLNNLALASVIKNNQRGDKPLSEFITYDMLKAYLRQFAGVKVKNFNGDNYIKQIESTVKKLI